MAVQTFANVNPFRMIPAASFPTAIFIVVAMVAFTAAQSPASKNQPTNAPEQRDDPQIAAALESVQTIAKAEKATVRDLAKVITTGRQCVQASRVDDAADVYEIAVRLCRQFSSDRSNELPAERIIAILAEAADALVNAERFDTAVECLKDAVAEKPTGSDSTKAGKLALRIGAATLDANQWLTAEQTYQMAIDLLSQSTAESETENADDLATARLGYAWVLVVTAGQTNRAQVFKRALTATQVFLQHHPSHPDASTALLLQLSCYTELNNLEAVSTTSDEILARHPESAAACEVLKLACRNINGNNGLAELSDPIRQYLIQRHPFILASPSVASNIQVLTAGLLAAVVAQGIPAEDAYAIALSVNDPVGDAATTVLEQLSGLGRDAETQRIAMRWISPNQPELTTTAGADHISTQDIQARAGIIITAGVREAACRWAGRTGNWSMLAMAASDETDLYSDTESETSREEAQRRGRSLHVERLFAEALLQTGKIRESLQLWERIVDHGGADDFPTLLRLAETAVAVGSVASASTRIAAARAAAGSLNGSRGGGDVDGTSGSAQFALTNLLAANLEIRQLRFDRGRASLEQVVRSSEASGDLRGRAQWMIGETFFMQEKFAEAIAAYRQVEAISNSNSWTAAALVQAGKSFEQLGRTREATVCYSTLVSRFGDSRHAQGARQRMAELASSGSSENPTMRR